MHLNIRKARLGGLFLGALLLVLAAQQWLPSLAQRPLIPALPQDPYIQVYFNHSQSSIYTDPYR